MGMTNNHVTNQLDLTIKQIPVRLESLSEEAFFIRKNDTWSPAEQVKHLELSVKPLILAFRLPGFMLRLLFGKPNRPSRTYEELLAKYHFKLGEGGKATSPYVPKILETGTGRNAVIADSLKRHATMLKAAARYKDKDLDRYILPHPLLGKITLREMLYFTDFHILHHLTSIEKTYMS